MLSFFFRNYIITYSIYFVNQYLLEKIIYHSLAIFLFSNIIIKEIENLINLQITQINYFKD
jgi:hypothetical protein